MHYAVPRLLYEAGRLDGFYTDICANAGLLRILKLVPNKFLKGGFGRFLSRSPVGIPTRLMNSFPLLGLEYRRRLAVARTREEAMQAHLWMGKTFGERVLKKAGQSWTAAYVFNSAGLEILEACRARNALGYLEQCSSPRLTEMRLLRDESARFPEWGNAPDMSEADVNYAEIEKKEWAAAHCILCPSEFVRNGLIEEGADPQKINVVPYGVDVGEQRSAVKGSASRVRALADQTCEPNRNTAIGGPRLSNPKSPLRVLVAGKVCLQKGSHCVYQAAALLQKEANFRMVGSIAGLPEGMLKGLREYLEVLGPVPRSSMSKHYNWADVFLLPSLCEGSATVTYEAMAYGLPVICTPNTGSVVRDGVEGFIVPIRDAAAIVDRLRRFREDPELLARMCANAAARAREFTVAKYGECLKHVLEMSRSN